MKLDLKGRDFVNEDEIEQMRLRKQIEKNNAGLQGHCWQQGVVVTDRASKK
ncbi:hypothetical protein PF008_g22869 [Phytophthora fragariae]|uniref:Uncharacterized protein n=1 Tax=Phytophthora fragariae TaxID=53985 RepID=A0A6G0QSL7_9STRA|nr:hypothetical protein PF008_g22869 [Phytophthora fragariae]